jgi:hypothetical protein
MYSTARRNNREIQPSETNNFLRQDFRSESPNSQFNNGDIFNSRVSFSRSNRKMTQPEIVQPPSAIKVNSPHRESKVMLSKNADVARSAQKFTPI